VTHKLSNPEFEAETYYFTENEGGRKTPVHSGYRGQFYYNNKNWDAPQEFIDKEVCDLGESIIVKMQTLSPAFHIGKLSIGQTFEIREGAKTIGKGKITKILRQDFHYWDTQMFLKNKAYNIKPYSGDNLTGFKIDFENYLIGTDIIETGQDDCMVKVICKLTKDYQSPSTVINKIIDCWKTELAIANHLFKVEFDVNMVQEKYVVERFNLTFATWDQIYLTGKILIE